LCGGFFFFLEEFWRRADGRPVINFYPWWPIGIAVTMLAFRSFNFIALFLPDYLDLGSTTNASGVNFSAFNNQVDFSTYNGNDADSSGLLNGLYSYTLFGQAIQVPFFSWIWSIVLLAPYAIPGELFEMLTGKGKLKVGEGNVTKAVLIVELFRIVKEWFLNFNRRGARR
jgi:hypothetical protein